MTIHHSVAIHATALVDEGAAIGAGTRVWHWVHISAGAVIGERCSFGQNVFVGNRVKIGNNVKIQNNVSVYDNVTLEASHLAECRSIGFTVLTVYGREIFRSFLVCALRPAIARVARDPDSGTSREIPGSSSSIPIFLECPHS